MTRSMEGGSLIDLGMLAMSSIHALVLLVRFASLSKEYITKDDSDAEGLSLLGYEGLNDIDPVYCMPADLIEKKGLKKNWAALPRRVG